ncbi:hypothetical protein FRC09_011525 [Ceratobasidium sp. 395]|nr:hypothetical protein FRC09_011525 [Ceratobasidium sp. 395]
MARRTPPIVQGPTFVPSNVVPLDAIPLYVPPQHPSRFAPVIALLSEGLVLLPLLATLFRRTSFAVREPDMSYGALCLRQKEPVYA